QILEQAAMDRSTFGVYLRTFNRIGDPDKLITLLSRWANRCDKHTQDSYPKSAYFRELLARALQDNGDYCKAAIQLKRAIAIHRSHNREVSDDAVRCLNFLGRNYLWTGRSFDAEKTLCEALILLDHLPVDQQGGRGFVFVDMAQMHTWDREYEAANELLQR